jgi:hypothetical protein
MADAVTEIPDDLRTRAKQALAEALQNAIAAAPEAFAGLRQVCGPDQQASHEFVQQALSRNATVVQAAVKDATGSSTTFAADAQTAAAQAAVAPDAQTAAQAAAAATDSHTAAQAAAEGAQAPAAPDAQTAAQAAAAAPDAQTAAQAAAAATDSHTAAQAAAEGAQAAAAPDAHTAAQAAAATDSHTAAQAAAESAQAAAAPDTQTAAQAAQAAAGSADQLSWVSPDHDSQLAEVLGADWRDKLPAELASRWGADWQTLPDSEKASRLEFLLPLLALPEAGIGLSEEERDHLDAVIQEEVAPALSDALSEIEDAELLSPEDIQEALAAALQELGQS